MRRAKIAPASSQQAGTLTLIEDYIRVAMQPFIDRKICSSFDVFVSRVDKQRIDALLRIYRGPRPAIDLRYAVLWDDQAKGA